MPERKVGSAGRSRALVVARERGLELGADSQSHSELEEHR